MALPARRDAFYWRALVSAASFVLFGISALLVSVVIVPLVALVSPDQATRRRRARTIIRVGLRIFVGFMSSLGGLAYEFRNVERLGRPGQLIVANHPSLIDVVFLLAFTPQANCVVKHAMLRNPLTRGAVRAAGYISNEFTDQMISDAVHALEEGQCLIMFPEGTRTTPGKPLHFHRGAANLAVRAAAHLTPVCIRCDPPALTKADPWYRITARRVRFTFEVGSDLDLSTYRETRSVPLASRALNGRLCEYFSGLAGRTDGHLDEGDR